jgi:hypothetical protein
VIAILIASGGRRICLQSQLGPTNVCATQTRFQAQQFARCTPPFLVSASVVPDSDHRKCGAGRSRVDIWIGFGFYSIYLQVPCPRTGPNSGQQTKNFNVRAALCSRLQRAQGSRHRASPSNNGDESIMTETPKHVRVGKRCVSISEVVGAGGTRAFAN